MRNIEQNINERVISTETAEAAQIREKRMEIELSELREHIKLNENSQTGIKKYEFSAEKKYLEFYYHTSNNVYKFSFDLRNNYPFFPPIVNFEFPTDIASPYELKSTTLDDILGESWSPCLNLWGIADRCGKFLEHFLLLVDEKNTSNSFTFTQKAFLPFKKLGFPQIAILLLILISLCLRFSIGLSGYSGYKNPPEYGDFEVHRHWMELAINLAPKEWYQESEQEYAYKGIDYPPFCVYLHYLMGNTLKLFLPEAFVFNTSRGYESETLKFYMRCTVVVLDLLIFCTGVLYFIQAFYKNLELTHKMAFAFLAINFPLLLLIDHGHFHYNCVLLGLSLWAMIFTINRHYTTATIIFCLAINFKQMGLYYSLAFFFFIIVRIGIDSSDVHKSFSLKENEAKIAARLFQFLYFIFKVGCLIIVTICVNLALWMPYIFSDPPVWKMVLSRIFPVHRGLYEDKVANFWCFLNNFVKMRTIFLPGTLTLLSAILTILSTVPTIIMIFKRPNIRTFIISAFNISMSFFLFSYMVHEKSILLPLLPFAILLYNYVHVYTTVMLFGLFSNFFLLRRDFCTEAYFGILILYAILGYEYETGYIQNFGKLNEENMPWIVKIVRNNHSIIKRFTVVLLTMFHIAEYVVKPPKRYPDIFLVLNVNVSFLVFFGTWIYSNFVLYWHIKTSKNTDTDLIDGAKRIIKPKKQ